MRTGKDCPETLVSIMLGDPPSEARAEAIYHMRLTLGKLTPFTGRKDEARKGGVLIVMRVLCELTQSLSRVDRPATHPQVFYKYPFYKSGLSDTQLCEHPLAVCLTDPQRTHKCGYL